MTFQNNETLFMTYFASLLSANLRDHDGKRVSNARLALLADEAVTFHRNRFPRRKDREANQEKGA